MKKRDDREYYGNIEFRGRKFALPYTPQFASDNEGIEFTARIGDEPFCEPLYVHGGDNFTTHYPYTGNDGKHRILRVRIDFVSSEQYESFNLAREIWPLLVEKRQIGDWTIEKLDTTPPGELRNLKFKLENMP